MRVGCIDQDLCLLRPLLRHLIGPVAATIARNLPKHHSDDKLDSFLGYPIILDQTYKVGAYPLSPGMTSVTIYFFSKIDYIICNVRGRATKTTR